MMSSTATATVTAPETYQLELQSAEGPVFRTVLKTEPRNCALSDVPVIDLAAINGSAEERHELAARLRAAATNMGFFYIKNHGITSIDAAFTQAKTFFAQPQENKDAVSVKKSRYYNGYGGIHSIQVSPSESRDYKEGFSFRYEPQYDPHHPMPIAEVPEAVRPFIRGEGFVWDGTAHLPGFKRDILQYWQDCLRLARKLIRVFALSLGLPEDHFDSIVTHPGSDMVLNYYPKNDKKDPSAVDAGIGSHTDLQCFTLLWQDAVGGLQVLTREGQWLKVPPIPDTIVVNIGDFLMRLSNDRFKSTVHRVYNFAPEDRYSMPFFFGFNFNEECSVLPTCTSESSPAKYKPISCGETEPYAARSRLTTMDPVETPTEASQKDSEEPRDRAKRHRRRIFSCESCQRRKCKCLFDTALRSCRQCHSLRVDCSLRESSHLISPTANLNVDSPGQQQLRAMEQRLQRNEEAIARLQEQLRHVSPRGAGVSQPSRTPLPPRPRRSPIWPAPDNSGRPLHHNPEELSAAADEAAGSAPVVVLREIDKHHTGRQRRKMGARSTDIVSMGIIDDATADSLIHLFHGRHGPTQFIHDIDKNTPSHRLRVQYPFLHGVFCLLGIMHKEDLVGSSAHFKINEHVRQTLGEALLASPLPMDAIYAILLVSEEATDPSQDATDYIDSWLLTGYCVQQAMLCFNFSGILSRIQHETSTSADQSSIRLWAALCLGHLRWSVTTGRQPVVPSAYLNHCNMLVNFYDASSEDGMLLAEVMLFWALWQMPVDARQRSDILDEWKEKWDHLLQLSISAKLWFSYHIASLISAIRVLERLGENLLSQTFLSPAQPKPYSGAQDADGGDDNMSDNEGSQGPADTAAKARLRQEAYHEAVSIVQQFLRSRASFVHNLRLSDWLCLAYSALIVGHYGEKELSRQDHRQQSRDNNRHSIYRCLEYMTQLDEMCRKPVGSMRVLPHAVRMAMAKLQTAAAGRRDGGEHHAFRQLPIGADSSHNIIAPRSMIAADPAAAQGAAVQFFGLEDNSDVLSNMNDFFSGGFLDFSYRDYMGQPLT